MSELLAGAAILLLAAAAAGRTKDLAKAYAGDLDHAEGVGAVDWSTRTGDVWRLESFAFEVGDALSITSGPAHLVVAAHDHGDGSRSAVWAALFPDEPAVIAASSAGDGEHARAIFLRFHPSRVGELFPSETVEPADDALWLVRARHLYAHKINSSWQWDNMPVVPYERSIVLDVDTAEGPRRFYMVDTDEGSVRYEPAFEPRTTPEAPATPVEPKEALRIFEAAWAAFDEEYPMFGVKDDVDWRALRKEYRALAREATTAHEVAGVIALLLSHLEDLHVWVRCGDTWVHCFNRFRVTNGNWNATRAELEDIEERKGLAFGRTDDGLGYINVFNLSTEGLDAAFDEALEALGDTTGLVVDLRFNGGGDELLGRKLAGRFLGESAVYSKNRYRSGRRHGDLGPVLDRVVEPRGPWRYTAPVAVLQGEKTMSSAESLVLMLDQAPTVTRIGDRTAGSSANPRRLELEHGIVVNLPRWLDLDADGQPIDGVGVAPDVKVEAAPGDFRRADPVMEAALEHLRGTGNEAPGKAD